MGGLNRTRLYSLLRAHATPGDEDETARLLRETWRAAGLQVHAHGRYAISATHEDAATDPRPVLLVCAHLDSPGFTVEEIGERYVIFADKAQKKYRIEIDL